MSRVSKILHTVNKEEEEEWAERPFRPQSTSKRVTSTSGARPYPLLRMDLRPLNTVHHILEIKICEYVQ